MSRQAGRQAPKSQPKAKMAAAVVIIIEESADGGGSGGVGSMVMLGHSDSDCCQGDARYKLQAGDGHEGVVRRVV